MYLRLFVASCLAVILVGCGQKGALYLPDEAQELEPASEESTRP